MKSKVFTILKQLARFRTEGESPMEKMLGTEHMLFWGKVGENAEAIEFVDLLKDLPDFQNQGRGFLINIIRQCNQEMKRNYKADTSAIQTRQMRKEIREEAQNLV